MAIIISFTSPDLTREISESIFNFSGPMPSIDRKSTRLNSSHLVIPYAVFCLKKKKNHFRLGSTLAPLPLIRIYALRLLHDHALPHECHPVSSLCRLPHRPLEHRTRDHMHERR